MSFKPMTPWEVMKSEWLHRGTPGEGTQKSHAVASTLLLTCSATLDKQPGDLGLLFHWYKQSTVSPYLTSSVDSVALTERCIMTPVLSSANWYKQVPMSYHHNHHQHYNETTLQQNHMHEKLFEDFLYIIGLYFSVLSHLTSEITSFVAPLSTYGESPFGVCWLVWNGGSASSGAASDSWEDRG